MLKNNPHAIAREVAEKLRDCMSLVSASDGGHEVYFDNIKAASLISEAYEPLVEAAYTCYGRVAWTRLEPRHRGGGPSHPSPRDA